jgi:hypothetical protein
MTTALEGCGVSASRPDRSLPPGKTRYPLYRKLGEPQGWSGQVRKISPPTGIRSPNRPTRSQSQYQLSYPAPRQSNTWLSFQLLPQTALLIINIVFPQKSGYFLTNWGTVIVWRRTFRIEFVSLENKTSLKMNMHWIKYFDIMALFLFHVQNASDAVNFNWLTTGDYWSTSSFSTYIYWNAIFKCWKNTAADSSVVFRRHA